MAAISSNQRSLNHGSETTHRHHGPVMEQLEGLIKVYKDGCVERPSIVPTVPCTASYDPAKVTARDVKLDNNLWTRVYVPVQHAALPVMVYFHGGGFCVGSAAWSCYHDFLVDLAVKAGSVIVSVNYRLAPENRLPAAYDDGFAAVAWIKAQALRNCQQNRWWLSKCDLSRLFLAGDSAGGNIAYHVAGRILTSGIIVKPLNLRGVILIQPFFGGESRTPSEKHNVINSSVNSSALTLSDSDTYWRMALPRGARVNRDHPWSNPLMDSAGLRALRFTPVLVCVSETDILKDRNLEFCRALGNAGNKKVETASFQGVGHAFQILYNSPMAHVRVQEMMVDAGGSMEEVFEDARQIFSRFRPGS